MSEIRTKYHVNVKKTKKILLFIFYDTFSHKIFEKNNEIIQIHLDHIFAIQI